MLYFAIERKFVGCKKKIYEPHSQKIEEVHLHCADFHFEEPVRNLDLMYQTGQDRKVHTTTANMHVTACLAGQKVDVEVGEDCRSLQALREAIVVALPQLCVEGFDVSVGGRALDDDEGVVSLTESACLDVVANTRGLAVLALREAGRTVSGDGLLEATDNGDVSLVTLYLDAGVTIDYVDDGQTPLHLACGRGRLEIATLLLDRGSTAIDEKTYSWQTPLHLSCRNGHVEIATLLLDRGSTALDEEEYDGQRPLHLACRRGHVEIATLLLDRGSTAIEEENGYCHTPLYVACSEGHVELATLLLDRGSTVIDEKDEAGETPLHTACCNGYLEIATLLLDRGSTAIDEKTNRGQTPLHFACNYGRLEIATLLLDRGSTAITEKDCDGRTPFHVACRDGYLEIATLLLDRGTAIDEKSGAGATLLHIARNYGLGER